jgi:hypothetical protein
MKAVRYLMAPVLSILLSACSNGTQQSQNTTAQMPPAATSGAVDYLVGTWTRQGPNDGVVRIEGDPFLPVRVSLYWPANDDHAHVLQMKVEAEGDGQLQVQSYYGKGKPSVLGQLYKAGPNDLTFNIPAQVDGNRVTVVRAEGSPSVTIESATLKRSAH